MHILVVSYALKGNRSHNKGSGKLAVNADDHSNISEMLELTKCLIPILQVVSFKRNTHDST